MAKIDVKPGTNPFTARVTREHGWDGRVLTHEVNIALGFNIEDLKKGIERWQNGALVQDALPFLRSEDREFIMTGITPNEWNAMFGTGG